MLLLKVKLMILGRKKRPCGIPIKHYKTIRHHKNAGDENCFRCGLYWQGLDP